MSEPRRTQARLREVSATWTTLLEAVGDFVERCRPGELALADAVKLEGVASTIRGLLKEGESVNHA